MPVLRYHHIGIPTDRPLPDADHIPALKLSAFGFEQSPFGVEWMSFDADCPLPDLVKTVPHVAFVVDDLGAALEDREILIPPNRPSPGLTVAFIVHNGAPVEIMQFDRPEDEIWPANALFK